MAGGSKKKYEPTPLEKIRGRTPQLKPADIVLVRNKRSMFRKFLRNLRHCFLLQKRRLKTVM